MTAHRPATVRFYFDADVLGLAKVIAALRPDATYPGDPGALIHKRLRPPCRIDKPATPDHVWIPVVAQEGWVIITRDSRIQHHRAEVAAVDAHGAKMVALAGADAGSTWLQLEIVMSQWRRIGALAERAGPFIWRARDRVSPRRSSTDGASPRDAESPTTNDPTTIAGHSTSTTATTSTARLNDKDATAPTTERQRRQRHCSTARGQQRATDLH